MIQPFVFIIHVFSNPFIVTNVLLMRQLSLLLMIRHLMPYRSFLYLLINTIISFIFIVWYVCGWEFYSRPISRTILMWNSKITIAATTKISKRNRFTLCVYFLKVSKIINFLNYRIADSFGFIPIKIIKILPTQNNLLRIAWMLLTTS